jgi:hypothetical protein
VSNVFQNRVVRPVRIVTGSLTLDGLLNISLGGRTLDELNLTSRRFLTLSTPRLISGAWDLGEGSVAVQKSAILFVLEIPDLGASLEKGDQDLDLRRFGRAAMRLRIGEHAVEGYVSTGPGGSPLIRLNQSAHPFIALQSAVVTGRGIEFSTPFLALNRDHILSAQEMYSVNLVAEEVGVGSAGEPS